MLRVNKAAGEIFLYGPIGEYFENGLTALDLLEAFDELGGKRATLKIKSPGGSVEEGIAMYTAAIEYKGGVDTAVDSQAASIAAILALSGERRTTSIGSRWMIHNASTIAMGNSRDLRKTAETLDNADATQLEVLKDKTGKEEAELIAMLNEETWFTAEQAVAVGLATEVTGRSSERPNVAAWFRNPPSALFRETCYNGQQGRIHLDKAKLLKIKSRS